MTSKVIIDKLREAVRRRFGAAAELDNVDVATVGGINRTVLFDLVEGAARRRLVLRQETYTTEYSPFLPPAKQWPLLEVCVRHGVPVPAPIFALDEVDQLGRGYVVAFVAGETLPKKLLTDAAFAPARALFPSQAAEALARLHAIAPAEVTLLDDVPDSIDALGAQREAYEIYGQPHPVLEYAFRYLEQSQPTAAPKVFIHGDFRTGNMLVDPNLGLTALLDWECSRLSAPEDELGWFCSRCWRFGVMDKEAGGFGTRAEFIAAYESGRWPQDRSRRAALVGDLRASALGAVQHHAVLGAYEWPPRAGLRAVRPQYRLHRIRPAHGHHGPLPLSFQHGPRHA